MSWEKSIQTKINEERHNAALGAFLGACVGDAAGAVLEFSPNLSEFPEEIVARLRLLMLYILLWVGWVIVIY